MKIGRRVGLLGRRFSNYHLFLVKYNRILDAQKKSWLIDREEKLILQLFPQDQAVRKWTSYGKFQWAAVAGSFKNPRICATRYSSCPIPLDRLSSFVRINY